MPMGEPKPITIPLSANNYIIGADSISQTLEASSVKTEQFELSSSQSSTCSLCGAKPISDWMRVDKTVYCTKCLNQAISHGWSQANLEIKRKKALKDVIRCNKCQRRMLSEHAWGLGSKGDKLVLCDACYLDLMDKAVEVEREISPRRNLVL